MVSGPRQQYAVTVEATVLQALTAKITPNIVSNPTQGKDHLHWRQNKAAAEPEAADTDVPLLGVLIRKGDEILGLFF